MNKATLYKKFKDMQIVWNCKNGYWCEVGCPHQKWTKEELQDALESKKRLEQAGLIGEILTNQK